MAIPFSDTINNTGIVQRARAMTRIDDNQWSIARIANSCNDWSDFIAGYAIGADNRFQWDDTNHTKLPEGTANLVANQSDYSFLKDEQGNDIITLLGISVLRNGRYEPLKPVDRNDLNYDISTFGQLTGDIFEYDKIADNVIRLDRRPVANVTNGIRFFFQRTPFNFAATDTTRTPGFSPLLHRGYVIASAYDIAITLGLGNLQALAVERQKEEEKVINYFSIRNQDERIIMTPEPIIYE